MACCVPSTDAKSGTGHVVPILDYFSRYQTALVASGYGAAFRVGRHLASGQVVVLLRGPHEFDEWYYPLLTPWVDSVPVRLDGDDDSSLVAALERGVDGVGGAGYPHARFLYVTNVAFLSIDPSHLTFLTFGMLAPPVAREHPKR